MVAIKCAYHKVQFIVVTIQIVQNQQGHTADYELTGPLTKRVEEKAERAGTNGEIEEAAGTLRQNDPTRHVRVRLARAINIGVIQPS